jgi:cell division topological specificity factor
MGLLSIINNLLGRTNEQSKNAAKDRLRLVLMHDRSDIPATMMEAIRAEMVQVLNKYVEIDQEALEVMLEKEAGSIGLVLNIPIRRVKSEAEAAEALAAMQSVQESKDKPAEVTISAKDQDEACEAEAVEAEAPAKEVKEIKESKGSKGKKAKETEAAASAD